MRGLGETDDVRDRSGRCSPGGRGRRGRGRRGQLTGAASFDVTHLGTRVFLGIPGTAPASGANRMQPPQAVQAVQAGHGERDATAYGPQSACGQLLRATGGG